jgi:hypothetical protein
MAVYWISAGYYDSFVDLNQVIWQFDGFQPRLLAI